MMRLIDADALLEEMNATDGGVEFFAAVVAARTIVASAPTIISGEELAALREYAARYERGE